MTQLATFVKEGKVKKLTNKCSIMSTQETTYMVGCNFCKTCPKLMKIIEGHPCNSYCCNGF